MAVENIEAEHLEEVEEAVVHALPLARLFWGQQQCPACIALSCAV
jgi:hypothetical protein